MYPRSGLGATFARKITIPKVTLPSAPTTGMGPWQPPKVPTPTPVLLNRPPIIEYAPTFAVPTPTQSPFVPSPTPKPKPVMEVAPGVTMYEGRPVVRTEDTVEGGGLDIRGRWPIYLVSGLFLLYLLTAKRRD